MKKTTKKTNTEKKAYLEANNFDFDFYLHNDKIKKSSISVEKGVISGRVVFYLNQGGKIGLEPMPLDDSFCNALCDKRELSFISDSKIYDYNTIVAARDYLTAVIDKYNEMNINKNDKKVKRGRPKKEITK